MTLRHGDSASEQLLLGEALLELREIACGTGDRGVRRRRAVARCSPQQLRDCQRQARPGRCPPSAVPNWLGSGARLWWRTAGCAAGAPGAFHAEDYSLVDGMLLCLCSRDWQALPPLLSQAMRCCSGFFASDLFLAWRLRELARQGRVGFAEADFAGQRVRRLAD